MILSGKEIERLLGSQIFIEPFEPHLLNPNSYNLRLHDELMVYEDEVLDMRKPATTRRIRIPEHGLILEPGRLYLGRTIEHTRTEGLVPMLEGRSSVGRLGMFVHITAGFGDVGFSGYWTLEIAALQPIRIYAGVSICQIFYHQIAGEYESYRGGKYQNNQDIQPSMLYRDFNRGAAPAASGPDEES